MCVCVSSDVIESMCVRECVCVRVRVHVHVRVHALSLSRACISLSFHMFYMMN